MGQETSYASLGDSRIAYQVIGDGPIDVLVQSPVHITVDSLWDEPRVVRFLERMSRFCRHIWFDGRGRGASDPMPPDEARFIENMSDEMLALLDALGIERASIVDLGYGSSSMLCAAAHPERVAALALFHPMPRVRAAPDYPDGWADTAIAEFLKRQRDTWGTEANAAIAAPGVSDDARLMRWLARAERRSCSPVEASWRFSAVFDGDVRQVLPAITVPTLVVTPHDWLGAAWSRFTADHIVGARHVVVPSADFLFFTADTEPILDALEGFLTGHLPTPNLDRVLATVVFTDLVGSTAHAARLGDRRWRELLGTHDALVRAELQRFRGREVKSTGDGFLATFDGPGRALRCASAIREALRILGVEVRIGLHTGEIELHGDDIGGIAVHIAQRVMTEAQPGEIIASSTVRDLVAGSGLTFEDRGSTQLRGVPDQWRLFAASV